MPPDRCALDARVQASAVCCATNPTPTPCICRFGRAGCVWCEVAGECRLLCDKSQHYSLCLQVWLCQPHVLSWRSCLAPSAQGMSLQGRAPEYLAAGSWPCSAPSAQGVSLQGPRARVPAPGRRGAGPGRALCRQQADRGHLPRRAAAGRGPGRAQGVRAPPWPCALLVRPACAVYVRDKAPTVSHLTRHMTGHWPRCDLHASLSVAAPAYGSTQPFFILNT